MINTNIKLSPNNLSKYLIIGDIHLHDSNSELRTAQVNYLFNLVKEYVSLHEAISIIFLGDIFDKRRPSFECMLDCKQFFDALVELDDVVHVYVLYGNHDQLYQKNNSESALLFSTSSSLYITLIGNNSIEYSKGSNEDVFGFIPYAYSKYEIEKIYEDMTKHYTNPNKICFGHFSPENSIQNTGGEIIIGEDFIFCPTIVGHIHDYKEINPQLICLGTPYMTSFRESKDKFVGLLSNKGLEVIPTKGGIYYLNYNSLDSLYQNIDNYADSYCIVKLGLEKDEWKKQYNLRDSLLRKYSQIKKLSISQENNISSDLFYDLPVEAIREDIVEAANYVISTLPTADFKAALNKIIDNANK